MKTKIETPFDSIEGSYEYVALLAETIEEVRQDVESEIAFAISKTVHCHSRLTVL